MNTSFRRILNLIRRTGDRMVVTDPEGEDAFVVMDIDQYEALVDVEEQLYDHMSGHGGQVTEDDDDEPLDLSDWPEEPDSEPTASVPDIWDVMTPAGSPKETWDYAKLSPEEQVEFERTFAEAARSSKPSPSTGSGPVAIPEPTPIPSVLEAPPQTNPSEIKKSDDFGEEQFYLEPVE